MIPPGVMIYFEVADALDLLPIEEKGRLFEAILAYGRYGEMPAFTGTLAALWAFIRPRIDRDAAAYREKVLTARYAAYARECKKTGATRLPREAWLAAETAAEAR